MPTAEDRVKQLTEKLAKAKKAMRQKQARKNAAETKKARALETRRKILAGAYSIKKWGNSPPDDFLKWLSENDRKAFTVQPHPQPSETQPVANTQNG